MGNVGPSKKSSRTGFDAVKGSVLTCWILLLVLMALFAATKQFTSVVTALAERAASLLSPASEHRPHPNTYLEAYLQSFDRSPPPIGAVLDALVMKPCWEEWIEKRPKDKRQEICSGFFRRIHDRLKSIDLNYKAESDKPIKVGFFIPDDFKDATSENVKIIELPPEAVAWVSGYGRHRTEMIKRNDFIDQIVLLVVLGAFGSLLFLIDKFISGEELSLAALAFRPIFGMFLAVAVFVIDMASHAVVSNANYKEMRPETLYLLALAGGLLSEKVYSFVIDKLGVAVKAQGVQDSGNQPKKDDPQKTKDQSPGKTHGKVQQAPGEAPGAPGKRVEEPEDDAG